MYDFLLYCQVINICTLLPSVLSMADGFDPASEFAVGTVHWADEDGVLAEEDNGTSKTRKRTRAKSITPAPEEKPTKKYKSIIKETVGLTNENWTNLTPAVQRHIAHNQGGDHHLSSQVTMDCEHNHQSTVTADMTNHMLDTWAKKGIELDDETQKTFILCNQAIYRQGMVVSARPKGQKDWHYIVYEFDPPPTQTTDAIYSAFRNQFQHPPDGVFHVPTQGESLHSQAATLYQRKRFHAYHDSPQAEELHQQYVAVTKQINEKKAEEPQPSHPQPKPPKLSKVELFGDDIPALPPMPAPVIPQMYPSNEGQGGGEGGGGIGGFFTNQLSELFNPQDIIDSLFGLAAL